jgi:tRNA nucleotidyltransferase (CCA-adding enzyme)
VLTLHDGSKVDVATARQDVYSEPGALPTVQFGLIEDDMRRRDMSVNALAVSLRDGRLLDLFHGVRDLSSGYLSILHENSFIDDPTRLIRLCRFQASLTADGRVFVPDPNTRELIEAAVARSVCQTISGNRIWADYVKILEASCNIGIAASSCMHELTLQLRCRISTSTRS